MYCTHCGAEINDEAVVCIHCGVATQKKNNSALNTRVIRLQQ